MHAVLADEPGDRRDVDDGAATRLLHQRDRVLHAEEDALGIDGHHLVPGGAAQHVGIVGAADAGVVDEHVELAERAQGGLRRGVPLPLARDIQLHEASLAASRDDLVGNLLTFHLEDVGNDDLRAFLREDRRLALPHAAGTTGHERDFSGESHRVLSFFRAAGVLSGRCAQPAMAPPFTPSTSPVT